MNVFITWWKGKGQCVLVYRLLLFYSLDKCVAVSQVIRFVHWFCSGNWSVLYCAVIHFVLFDNPIYIAPFFQMNIPQIVSMWICCWTQRDTLAIKEHPLTESGRVYMRKTASSRCSLKSSLYHDYMFIFFSFHKKMCEVSIIALLFIFNRPEKLVYGSKKSLAGNGNALLSCLHTYRNQRITIIWCEYVFNCIIKFMWADVWIENI